MKLHCEFFDMNNQIGVVVEFEDGSRETVLRFYTPKWVLGKYETIKDKENARV